MRKQGFGRIINISSTSGMYGTPKLATYCMAKWGVRGLTKTLAQELKGTGIAGAAVVSALFGQPDIQAAAQHMRKLAEEVRS